MTKEAKLLNRWVFDLANALIDEGWARKDAFKKAQLCRISSLKPQVKTREQVAEMASHTSDYKPTRDKTYWLIHLEKPLDETRGKVFNKSLLLSLQEQRGAFWIKKYEEAIKAFE